MRKPPAGGWETKYPPVGEERSLTPKKIK